MIATISSTLHEAHLREWTEGSAVSEEIARLNVRSLDDTTEIKRLLNHKPNERWQQWKHGAGWWVSGVDPETGERTEAGGQFKPDTPIPVYENGMPKLAADGTPKTRKYANAEGYESQPIFLDTGDPAYWQRVLEDASQAIAITEGGKKAGSVLTAGIPTISVSGVGNGQLKGRLKDALKKFCRVGRSVFLCFDADWQTNVQVRKDLDRLARLISRWGAVAYIVVWPRQFKGIDDFIVANGHAAVQPLFDRAQTFEEWRDENPEPIASANVKLPDAEKHFTQQVQDALYGDKPWVCIKDVLHCWTGTHYEPSPDPIEIGRIWRFCNEYVVQKFDRSGESRWVYQYATPGHVRQALDWIKQSCAIDPNKVNPPGLNCTNGVLQIRWNGRVPSWELEAHDSRNIYIYEPIATYDPDANSEACDRLLACLDPAQQQIFLRTIAASLDLETVRKWLGRLVRALLLKGDGANGKDTLREAIAALYGYQGITGCTFADCKQYDEGRKFPLAKLGMSRVNWATENQDTLALDKLQILKGIITGEPMDAELKGKDDFQITPKCILLFNVNETPSITAALEAIKSRYGILKFPYTFKKNADPTKGELEADPRFKHDREFLKSDVLPALLNRILASLQDLMREGICYDAIDGAIEEAREESCHLYQFARECGLSYDPNAETFVGDIWAALKQWYVDTGTLEIEITEKGKEKTSWIDQPNRFDPNVKAAHHLVARLQKLYPKIRRGKRCNGHGIPLIGLRLENKPDLSEFSGPIAISDPKPPFSDPKNSFSDPNLIASNPDSATVSTFSDPKTPNFAENLTDINLVKNDDLGSLKVQEQTEQAFQPSDLGSLKVHLGSLKDHCPPESDKPSLSPPPDSKPEIGDTVIAMGAAQWVRKGSDPFPTEAIEEIPKKQRHNSTVPINLLPPALFAELVGESEVINVSKDGRRVRVRQQQTGRYSVFAIEHTAVLRKGGATWTSKSL